jgi:type VI secretion system VasD/TssJ family lipoprotein
VSLLSAARIVAKGIWQLVGRTLNPSQVQLLTLCCWVTACAHKAEPKPECKKVEQLTLRVEPNAVLNQDREGNPRSVVVRVFQLESPDAFEHAGFEDLWTSTSAPSVVAGPDELVVIPGRNQQRVMPRNPKATHIGVAAKFRVVQERPGYRAVLTLPEAATDPCAPGAGVELRASLRNYAVELQ